MKIISTLIFLSFFIQVEAQNTKFIQPDDKSICIEGSNYIKMKNSELVVHRHSDKIYEGTTKGNLFNPVKARTSSGIVLKFKSNSPTINVKLRIKKGLKKRPIFSVFQNNDFVRNISFPYIEEEEVTINLMSNYVGKEVLYKINFPLKTDIGFIGLELELDYDLVAIPKDNKPIYVAYGNSITHGTGQKTTPQTYPYILSEKMGWNMFNLAVGGGKTSQVMAEMIRDDFKKIDVMTILIGFNDYNGEGIDTKTFTERYTRLLKTIREKHTITKLYCITMTYTKAFKSKTSGIPIDDFRNVVRDIVSNRQVAGDENIFLIEGDKITNKDNLKDKVHFSVNGSKDFANSLYEKIKYFQRKIQNEESKEQISNKYNLKGINIIDGKKLKYLNSNNDFGKITKIKVEDRDIFSYNVETKVQPKFIYDLSTSIPLFQNLYSKGRVFLLSFNAKSLSSGLETGEAKALFSFRQSNSYKNNIETTLSLSSEWNTYYVPFQSNIDIPKDDFALIMQYGYRPQSFLIKDIKFEVFPENTKIFDLPKTQITYTGMESNAKWRIDALKRIDKIRKSDFTIQFKRNGTEVKNKEITLELVKHKFPFGAAMRAKEIVNNTDQYRNFKKAFNFTVLENDLKIKRWTIKNRQSVTLQALDILQKDKVDVKGHVLIWPGFNYLTPKIFKNRNNPDKVSKILFNHVRDILKKTKGKVSRWDVVNEAYTNKDLQNITGSEKILFQGFRITENKNPEVGRFTNEYGIITNGGIDTKKQQWYYDYIQRIDDYTGGLVDGIGIQCHMGSDLTSPQRVLEILDFYANLNKKISISEFTMDIQDSVIREQYTRDFIIAAFSHPSVSEFLFWGCTEDKQNKVDIFKLNGELGIMGIAYFDLVYKLWKTNITSKTDEKGKISNRGFYGTYNYSFIENGKEVIGKFELNPNGKKVIEVTLPPRG